jgi:hypothetical protein
MLATVLSRAPFGMEAPEVTLDVHVTSGLPTRTLVGLAKATAKEGKDRVRSALLASGFDCSPGRVTIHLAPRTCRKRASESICRTRARCAPSTLLSAPQTRLLLSGSTYELRSARRRGGGNVHVSCAHLAPAVADDGRKTRAVVRPVGAQGVSGETSVSIAGGRSRAASRLKSHGDQEIQVVLSSGGRESYAVRGAWRYASLADRRTPIGMRTRLPVQPKSAICIHLVGDFEPR